MPAKLIELLPATRPSRPSVRLTAFVIPTKTRTISTHLKNPISMPKPLKI